MIAGSTNNPALTQRAFLRIDMSTKYATIDQQILDAVAEKQPASFTTLFAGLVRDQCEQIASSEGRAGRPSEPFRILDRRLQALRKAGKIAHTTKPEGWSLAGKEA